MICSASSFLSSTQPIVGGAAFAVDAFGNLDRRQQPVKGEEVAGLGMAGIAPLDARPGR